MHNIKLDFSKQDEKMCSGFIWLRIGICSGLLWNTVIKLWVPYRAANLIKLLE
jgi:hypothetical protein